MRGSRSMRNTTRRWRYREDRNRFQRCFRFGLRRTAHLRSLLRSSNLPRQSDLSIWIPHESLRVGMIGCGRISDIYLKNCAEFDGLEIVACASLDIEESRSKAAEYDIPKACAPDEVYADAGIDAVLNLTVPEAHFTISRLALESGKHVYAEKPFVTDRDEGLALLELGRERGLLVGNAPDTFLGGRWQTVRKLLDSGIIGAPTGVAAFVPTHGVERHHPNPDFYYAKGGGPLLDLGPIT